MNVQYLQFILASSPSHYIYDQNLFTQNVLKILPTDVQTDRRTDGQTDRQT